MKNLYMNPEIIFALLCIILGVINMFLWVLLWKKTGLQQPDINLGLEKRIEEIKASLEASAEKTLNFEDQLWGVMDKFKEQEILLKQIKENIPKTNIQHGIISEQVTTPEYSNEDISNMIEDLKKPAVSKEKSVDIMDNFETDIKKLDSDFNKNLDS